MRFEDFLWELADLNDAGQPDPVEVAEIAERYQLPRVEPDWWPDVLARYGLTPPPDA